MKKLIHTRQKNPFSDLHLRLFLGNIIRECYREEREAVSPTLPVALSQQSQNQAEAKTIPSISKIPES